MKQKEVLVCKAKAKTKTGYIYKEHRLDIFDLHDESGVSLGQHLLELEQKYERLLDLYEIEKKMRVDLIKALGGDV